MKNYKNILLSLHNTELTPKDYLSLLDFICTKIDINTISGMARSENKTPRGIKVSNQYQKINIGDARLCIKGIEKDKLPF